MGVLDAVLQMKATEAAQQKAQSDSLLQATQLFQQARQQSTENQLKGMLVNAQVGNYQAEALKNSQSVAAQQQQNQILQQVLNGGGGSSPGGFGVKSIKIGDVTLEPPTPPINGGVPLNGIESIQDPNMRNMVKGVLDYKIDPSKSASLRNDQRQKIVEMAAAVDPTYDQTQFPARAQFRKSLTSGQLSKNIVSANTVIGHLGSLQDSFDQLNKSRVSNDIPAINAVENFALTHTGKGVVKSAKLNADAVSNELETLFRGTNGSLTGVEEFKKNFNLDGSPEQQKAVIQKAIDLVASRVGAIDSQNQEVMGKPRDFSVLNPKSKAIIAKLGADPSVVDSIGSSPNVSDHSKMTTEQLQARLKELQGGK